MLIIECFYDLFANTSIYCIHKTMMRYRCDTADFADDMDLYDCR